MAIWLAETCSCLYVKRMYVVFEQSDAASQVLRSVDVANFDSRLLRTSLNKQ